MTTSDVGNGFRQSEEAWPTTMKEELPLTIGCSSGWSGVISGTEMERDGVHFAWLAQTMAVDATLSWQVVLGWCTVACPGRSREIVVR